MSWWWTRWLRIHLLPLVVPKKRAELLAAGFGHVHFFTLSSLETLLRDFDIEDVRGFRFFSSRHLPLENGLWYYRLNTWWGRTPSPASRRKSTWSPGNLPGGSAHQRSLLKYSVSFGLGTLGNRMATFGLRGEFVL